MIIPFYHLANSRQTKTALKTECCSFGNASSVGTFMPIVFYNKLSCFLSELPEKKYLKRGGPV